MANFTVNNQPVTVEKNTNLLRFLRDELRLTSVKDGCSEGVCGTCTVLVDGKAQKACVLQTDRLEGKNILTLEGFPDREREVYATAFAQAGAVQCGFCIPGMIISAKALIDQNPNPAPEDVKLAIRNNICRCTGYVKIEEAILNAAAVLRGEGSLQKGVSEAGIGKDVPRVDAFDKASGKAIYADDLVLDGMLYGSAVRSEYPRARVLAIHTEEAKKAPGVVAVLTAEDIPGGRKIGHIRSDWDVMIPAGEITHYLGDSLALVAAVSKEALAAAKALVKVDYEPLDPILSAEDALREGAPLLHETGNLLTEERLIRGNAREKIAASKYVVTNHYSTPFNEHAFLEPETAVALPEGDTIRIYCADQGVYQTRRECAQMLGVEADRVRVTACMVGGGFGGKEDQVVQHHAALLAYHTRRPVKVSLTRAQSILIHPKRHPMELTVTTACDENGILTGMTAYILTDTGAYASLGAAVLQRACTHAAGPYKYQDIEIIGRAAYTNNPPAGPFRGFGVPQSCFAIECNINKLAELVGISPWEIRYRNAIRPGDVLPNGQLVDEDAALVETLLAVKPAFDKNPKAGIACALKNSGVGVGLIDVGRCRLDVLNGKVHIRSSAACIGQGFGTVALQMVCETAGLSPDKVVYHAPDTALAPNAGNTTASRQTLFTGESASAAAKKLREALDEEGSLEALEGRSFEGEFSGVTDKMNSDKPFPISHVAYSYATHLVELDEDGRIDRVIAAHDIGTIINPRSLEGQVEGGVVMSLGYTLTENFPLENGRPLAKFGTLGLWRSTDIPKIEVVLLEKNHSPLAYGAKGVGEISSIPTTPAVQLAYYNRDGIFRTKLPMEDTAYSKKKKPAAT
ncbi:MAG: selenium-dependent xanthine dehydrogenase [Bacillota bacterium]